MLYSFISTIGGERRNEATPGGHLGSRGLDVRRSKDGEPGAVSRAGEPIQRERGRAVLQALSFTCMTISCVRPSSSIYIYGFPFSSSRTGSQNFYALAKSSKHFSLRIFFSCTFIVSDMTFSYRGSDVQHVVCDFLGHRLLIVSFLQTKIPVTKRFEMAKKFHACIYSTLYFIYSHLFDYILDVAMHLHCMIPTSLSDMSLLLTICMNISTDTVLWHRLCFHMFHFLF